MRIGGYGPESINGLGGWEIEFSDIIVTLTKPTALVTTTTVNSTTVGIDNGDGVMDDVSTVSSFNISSSAVNPTVTNIGSYSGSTATLTLSAAQSLEAGETLTFDGAGKYTNNDLTYTGDLTAGTMIYVGVGTNTSGPDAKNARGYMSITITAK